MAAGVTATLDLAGHVLTGTNTPTKEQAVVVNGELTIKDSVGSGEINTAYTGTSGRVVTVNDGGKLVLESGTISDKGMAQAGNAVSLASGAFFIMNGGTVEVSNSSAYAVRSLGSGSFTMADGTISTPINRGISATALAIGFGGTVNVSGGTLVSKGDAVLAGSASVSITGGSFTGKLTVPKQSISGGTFTVAPAQQSMAAGRYAKSNQDGTYSAAGDENVVALCDGVEYASLADAFAAASDGSTVSLLQNAQGKGLMLKAADAKTVTIDFNGYTYAVTDLVGSTNSENQAVHFEAGNTVTLKNGTLKVADSAASQAKILVQNYSALTAEGMTFDGANLLLMSQQPVTLSNNGNKSVYKNCKVTTPDRSNAIAVDSSVWGPYTDTDVTLDGCTVNGDLDIAQYVLEGKTYVRKDGVAENEAGQPCLTIQGAGSNYSDISDAVLYAVNGTNLTLLKDVTASVVIPEGKTLGLYLGTHKLTNEPGKHTIENHGTLTIGTTVSGYGNIAGTVDNVSHAKAALYNAKGATAIIKGGVFERSKEAGTFNPNNGNGNSWYTIDNDGVLTITKGGTTSSYKAPIVRNAGGFSSAIHNGADNNDGNIAQLTINAGEFSGGKNVVKTEPDSEMNIAGGTFEDGYQYTLMNWGKAKVTGGEFKAPATATAVLFSSAYDGVGGTLEVTGGTFTTEASNNTVIKNYYDDSNKGTVAVSGGTFSAEVPADCCADTYVPAQNTDGTYGVGQKDTTAQEGISAVVKAALANGAANAKDAISAVKKALAASDYSTATLKAVTVEDGDTAGFTATVTVSYGETAQVNYVTEDINLGTAYKGEVSYMGRSFRTLNPASEGKADIRFGYQATGAFADYGAGSVWWTYSAVDGNPLSHKVVAENYVDNEGEGTFTSNIVFTGIDGEHCTKNIRTQMHVAKAIEGVSYEYIDQVRTNSGRSVMEAATKATGLTADQKQYASDMLDAWYPWTPYF